MVNQREGEFRDGMPFLGGRLWLDLLNTVVADGAERRDLIAGAPGLALWLAAAGIEAPPCLESAAAELRDLREALRPAVALATTGFALPAALVSHINRALEPVAARMRLGVEGGRPKLVSWIEPGPAGPAGLVADDFARFVCEAEPERLKHCAKPECLLVFYDSGKNNTRRWCSMSACGNRDKVARYRARRRDGTRS